MERGFAQIKRICTDDFQAKRIELLEVKRRDGTLNYMKELIVLIELLPRAHRPYV